MNVRLRGVVFFIMILPLSGCRTTKASVGMPSPFASYYRNGLNTSFEAPEISKIKKMEQTWEYNRPFKEVWKAALDVLMQYQGIVKIKGEGTQKSLLVLKARDHERAPDNKERIVTYGGFFEQWLAIGFSQEVDSDITEIHVASLDPYSGNLRKNSDTAQGLFSQIQTQLFSRALWQDKFNLSNQDSADLNASLAKNVDIEKKPYKFEELEKSLGNWISKRMQDELITVNAPEVTDWLNHLVERLKLGIGKTDIKTNVIIISTNALNAFALPNGDILVSAGLLERFDTTDEIAAVLAHELDHLVQHDVIARLGIKNRGETTANLLRTGVAVGDLAIQMLGAISGYGQIATTAIDVGRAGVRGASELGAQRLETGMVANYSKDIELRADTNGFKYLTTAGFKGESNIAMLNNLAKLQNNVLEKKNPVISNLINMEPGLNERIENLKKIIAKQDDNKIDK